jgi:hypothetical protein
MKPQGAKTQGNTTRRYSVKSKDKRMMNWKGYRRKRLWPNFKVLSQQWPEGTEENHKKTLRIASLQAKI